MFTFEIQRNIKTQLSKLEIKETDLYFFEVKGVNYNLHLILETPLSDRAQYYLA